MSHGKKCKKQGRKIYVLLFLFSVEEILEDLKAASPEDPVYTLNQELTRYRYSFPLKYKVPV